MSKIENLPEDCSYHFGSFLNGRDLISLSKTCRTFRYFPWGCKELAAKNPLIIDFRRTYDFIRLAQSIENRNVLFLRLLRVQKGLTSCGNLPTNFRHFLETVSKSVLVLEVEDSRIKDGTFSVIMDILLTNLQACTVKNLVIETKGKHPAYKMPENDFALKSLTFFEADEAFLSAFGNCKKIQTFDYTSRYKRHKGALVNFLRNQQQIKELYIDFSSLTVVQSLKGFETCLRTNNSQLEKLHLKNYNVDDIFLGVLNRQKSLKSLGLKFNTIPSRDMMSTICSMRKLEEIVFYGSLEQSPLFDYDRAFGQFRGLVSNSVKQCKFECFSMLVPKCLDIFKGVAIIDVNRKIFEVPHEMLKFIRCSDDGDISYFWYAPQRVTETFQADVMEFLTRHATLITSIDLGKNDWPGLGWTLNLEFVSNIIRVLPQIHHFSFFSRETLQHYSNLNINRRYKIRRNWRNCVELTFH